MTKARCTECDFIVVTDPDETAKAHGWIDSGQCPGTGQPTKNPNRKTF
jgi:hypothetical protein